MRTSLVEPFNSMALSGLSGELRDESKFSAGSLTGEGDLERGLRLRDLRVGEALPPHWEQLVYDTVQI